ncbi:hypothetical protein MDAP_002879 [Mitosporidium daphniae]
MNSFAATKNGDDSDDDGHQMQAKTGFKKETTLSPIGRADITKPFHNPSNTNAPLEIGRSDWDPFAASQIGSQSSGMLLSGASLHKEASSPRIKGLHPDAVPPGVRFDIIHPAGVEYDGDKDLRQHPFLRVSRRPSSTRFE